MMRMRNKRAFTLLEMMIALMILSFIGAMTAVQIKKMIATHRFEAGVADLFLALQEAQILSATYQTDFSLDITSSKGKVDYRFSTYEPLSAHQFNQESKTIAYAHSCKFNNTKTTTLHLDIYSGGRIEPRGTLAFYTHPEEEKALWFDLQRGHLIKFSHYKPALISKS